MHWLISVWTDRVSRRGAGNWASRLALPFLAVWLAAGLAKPQSADPCFDGHRAMVFLRTQCGFGPRPPGSRAHTRCRDWITDTCRSFDLATTHQSFRADIALMERNVRLTNIIAVHQPQNPRRIMLSAHWDTRPVADLDPEPSARGRPILGANDGASGVAVLLELARVFRECPPSVGIVFVFFDGEDAGISRGGGWCLGSRHLAANLRAQWEFDKGVNIDMVGDRDLAIPQEQYSWSRARELTRELWNLGSALYPATFQNRLGPRVEDDHLAFLKRGKAYVNVIDFDYPYWHTLEDTEDKCAAESLQRVGTVIARFVQNQ